jgi:molecular chaperone GrpE
MNDTTPKKSNSPPPEGFTDLTGPAAFRAQMLKEQEQAENTNETASEASDDDITVEDYVSFADEIKADKMGAQLLTKLQQQVKDLEAQVAESKDQILRAAAETENLRKRFQREREDASKFAVTSFAKDLLDVADTFRRALDAIPAELRQDEKILPLIEGIEATERAFLRSFERHGIKKIEPIDEPFNPNFHEVIFEAPVAGKASGMIIQLVEAGYTLHERLLRPARVGVAKGDPALDPARNVDTQA